MGAECVRNKLLIACILITAYGRVAAAQRLIQVPQDEPTIQSGIDASNSGDTVLVSPGVYRENLDFRGKAITVTTGARSFGDTSVAATIIEGSSDGPVVSFSANETAASDLNGFTIQGGYSIEGSSRPATGIFISGASPTITNNIITGNTGSGVLITQSGSPLIQDNIIRDSTGVSSSTIPGGVGTGVMINALGSTKLLGNIIENNVVDSASPSTCGGGVEISSGSAAADSEILLENNIVRNNRANCGSGIFQEGIFSPPNLVLIQNLVYGNTFLREEPDGTYAGVQVEIGGAVQPPYPRIVEVNNSIYGPGTGEELVYAFAPSVIENNVFVNSRYTSDVNGFPGVNAGLWCADGPAASSSLGISYNDIFNDQQLQDSGCSLGTSNLSVDPVFIDASNGNFHVEQSSPVIAMGDVNATEIPTSDLAGKNRFVCGTVDMGAYEVHPRPATVVTSSNNPSVGGNSVTFTAKVPGNCNVPTGPVTFLDGVNSLGTETLDSAAMASVTTSTLTVGTHTITVSYPGDFNFYKSVSAPLIQVVTGAPTATTLSVIPNPASAFTPITFSSTVSSSLGQPTGTVVFTANGQTVATTTVGANGVASATVSTLGAGNYSIVATYQATTTFETSSSAAVNETVIGAESVTSLTGSPNPATSGQTVTFTASVRAAEGGAVPSGTVTFSDGSSVLGSASLSTDGQAIFDIASLAAGTHTITASYGGSSNFEKSSASVAETVTLIPTTTVVTASPNPAGQGQPVTLTATVSATSATPAGTVTFDDGGTAIGTATLNGAGAATLTTSTLAIGTHSLTAIYAGGGSLGGSSSPVFQETIVPVGFTVSVTPATLTMRLGQSGSVSVEVGGYGGYTGTISLSTNSLPQYVTGTFNPSSLTLQASGDAKSTLTISTAVTPLASAQNLRPFEGDGREILAGSFAFLLLLPLWRRRRRLPALLWIALGVFTLGSASGCGGTVEIAVHAVSPGTYVVPIRARGVTGTTKTSQLTLVITP